LARPESTREGATKRIEAAFIRGRNELRNVQYKGTTHQHLQKGEHSVITVPLPHTLRHKRSTCALHSVVRKVKYDQTDSCRQKTRYASRSHVGSAARSLAFNDYRFHQLHRRRTWESRQDRAKRSQARIEGMVRTQGLEKEGHDQSTHAGRPWIEVARALCLAVMLYPERISADNIMKRTAMCGVNL
jgi:hypothetical protein